MHAACATSCDNRSHNAASLGNAEFKNNMSAGGVLQAKPGTKPETIRKMEKRIEENFSGSDKAFRTLVLRDNFVWHTTQVDPQKAQLSDITDERFPPGRPK